jgi:hypothetical protein
MNFMQIRPVGAELYKADRQKDIMKQSVSLRNFANAPKILHFAHTVLCCNHYRPQNKYRLFPCTALTEWWRRRVFTVRNGLNLYFKLVFVFKWINCNSRRV